MHFLTSLIVKASGPFHAPFYFANSQGQQVNVLIFTYIYWLRYSQQVLRRICSRTFSVRLHPSPSVPVCSPPFYYVLPYYSILLRPLLSHPCLCYVSVYSISSFQPSTLGSDPFSVSSDLAFMLFLLLFGYNPYQPNSIAPHFLIVFCSLLSYDPFVPIVPICINYDKL